MRTGISIVRPGNVHEIRVLYEQLVVEMYPSPDARKYFLQQWKEQDLSEACRVDAECVVISASDDLETVIGFLYGGRLEGGVGTVFWLGVDPGHRRNGIGHDLLVQAEIDFADRGAHKVKLFCNTSMARKFYLRCGYQEEGFHPNHWWNMDCWSMGKSLSN